MESLSTSTGSAASPDGNVATNEESSPLSPPYWKTHFTDESATSVERRHLRSQIQLEDHTEESSEQSKALWAKAVRIDDHVVVRGAAPAIGAYVVWNCTVDLLNVSLIIPLLLTRYQTSFIATRPDLLFKFRLTSYRVVQ
jgi:hypothetical protein